MTRWIKDVATMAVFGIAMFAIGRCSLPTPTTSTAPEVDAGSSEARRLPMAEPMSIASETKSAERAR